MIYLFGSNYWNTRKLFTEVFAQLASDDRVAQAAERLGFNLADAFAGHTHLAANLFPRVSLSVQQSIAQL